MYFDFRTFFRLMYLSFLSLKEAHTGPVFKRILLLVCFFGLFPVFECINFVCFLLDDLFFPDWPKTELKKPVFIVGNPRSGTTFIHRLMAKDEERFFCFRTWEIIFPSIIQKKVFSFFGRMDKVLGGTFTRRLSKGESDLFRNFNKIHRISLFSPEEDDKLLIHSFSFHGLVWLFPYEELSRFHYFDQMVEPREKKRVMTFYRNCIKRQTYFKGNQKQFLSKNPVSSLKIDSLYEYFPGCKFIYMVRNPLEVLPSTLNMAREIWGSMSNEEASSNFREKVYETVKLFYAYPLSRFETAPEGSYILIKYDELVTRPDDVIKSVYRKFGFKVTETFSAVLEEERVKSKNYKSNHIYSLDEFYLSHERILSDFRNVFERFAFESEKAKPRDHGGAP